MKVFVETQRFNQWWFRLLIILVATISIGTIVMSYQGIQSEPVPFWISLVAGLLTLTLVLSLGFLIKLETKIDDLGIHYGFWPFYRNLKIISWSDIEKCTIRKYSPIGEYGGWGYRTGIFSKSGTALNVKGDIGIQIVFKSGKRLLIGTQKKEDAMKVLETYNQKIRSNEH